MIGDCAPSPSHTTDVRFSALLQTLGVGRDEEMQPFAPIEGLFKGCLIAGRNS